MKKVALKLTPLATAELCFVVLLVPIMLLYFQGTLARRALKANMAEALYAFDGEDLETCLEYLGRAQKKGNPYYPYIHQIRGKISADIKENWGQATEDYTFLEGISGSEALATLGKGLTAINQTRDKTGKPTQKGVKDAKQLFKDAENQDPNFIDAKICIAAIEITEGNYERGLSTLKSLEKKALEANSIPSVDGLVALYFAKGLAHNALKDYEQALINFKKAWQYRKLWPESFAPTPYINYERCLAKHLLKEDLSAEDITKWLAHANNYLQIEQQAYYLTLNGRGSKPRLDLRLGTYSLYMAINSRLIERAEKSILDKRLEDASADISVVFKYLIRVRRNFGDFEFAHRFTRITGNWTRMKYSSDGNTIDDIRKGVKEECVGLSNRDVYRMNDKEYYKLMINHATVIAELQGMGNNIAEEKLKTAMEIFPLERAAYENMEILIRNHANQFWNSGQFDLYDQWVLKADAYKGNLQGTTNSITSEINTYRETQDDYYTPQQEALIKKLGKPK
ncbi:MAG: hypothetical protein AABZ60_21685 [Planctomycetota bacterium]